MGWIHERAFAVFDCETTGLNWDQDKLVEVAVVLIDGGQVSSEHSWLLNPGVPIPLEASAVHGITDEEVVGAPTLGAVSGYLLRVLAGRIPVAYNVPFDRSFLHAAVRALNAPTGYVPAFQYEIDWIDPLVWARKLFPALPSRKLGEVAKHLGLQKDGLHRALADAQTTADVFLRIACDLPEDFDAMLAEQRELCVQQRAKYAKRLR